MRRERKLYQQQSRIFVHFEVYTKLFLYQLTPKQYQIFSLSHLPTFPPSYLPPPHLLIIPPSLPFPCPMPMASLVPVTDETSPPPQTTVPAANGKLKRFRFIEAYDLSLLKAVRCINAHILEWGKAELFYDEFLNLFLSEIPDAVFLHS